MLKTQGRLDGYLNGHHGIRRPILKLDLTWVDIGVGTGDRVPLFDKMLYYI